MRTNVLLCLAATLAITPLLTACEGNDDYVPGSYRVREDGVALRTGGDACTAHPGPTNCTEITRTLRRRERVYPICQDRGETVGTNAWWLYADGPRGTRGWVASWFLDHPTNRLPGVPTCTPAHITPPRT